MKIIIIAAVLIVIILLIPSNKSKNKKKKQKIDNGTYVWENKSSMRFAQFIDHICRKIKELIGG